MKYAGILKNDFVNGEGVCVSFWTQGCPFHCPGCHNSQTWDFNGGLEGEKEDLIAEVCNALNANGVHRNLSILGGEPLCGENAQFVADLIFTVRILNPHIKIFVWTGYELDELKRIKSTAIDEILDEIDVLITGRFILAERDITLKWIGSRNQKILQKGIDF